MALKNPVRAAAAGGAGGGPVPRPDRVRRLGGRRQDPRREPARRGARRESRHGPRGAPALSVAACSSPASATAPTCAPPTRSAACWCGASCRSRSPPCSTPGPAWRRPRPGSPPAPPSLEALADSRPGAGSCGRPRRTSSAAHDGFVTADAAFHRAVVRGQRQSTAAALHDAIAARAGAVDRRHGRGAGGSACQPCPSRPAGRDPVGRCGARRRRTVRADRDRQGRGRAARAPRGSDRRSGSRRRTARPRASSRARWPAA